ncbi:MAG: hypothetical protein WAL04_03095 [Acidimicrobiales bacterium]|jgi:hypothetical protein
MKTKSFNPDRDVADWDGPTVRYDLFKEVTVCFVIVLILVAALSAIFSSPDEHPVTVKSWSAADPADFLQTAIAELSETSATGTYGPPYTATCGLCQKIGPVSLESLAGTRIAIDTAQDFVIGPLLTLPNAPALDAAIATFKAASAKQQASWESAYATIAASPSFTGSNVKAGAYGPVGPMMSQLLAMARSGALDGALLASPQLYNTNYTKPLLFIQDGGYLASLADAQNLGGDQWGMMNETGSYPGQAWLWLYTLWYQVPPMNTSSNGDAEVWAIMMALTLLLALVPFIPGLRSIPRWTRLYRLVWRRHYRSLQ